MSLKPEFSINPDDAEAHVGLGIAYGEQIRREATNESSL